MARRTGAASAVGACAACRGDRTERRATFVTLRACFASRLSDLPVGEAATSANNLKLRRRRILASSSHDPLELNVDSLFADSRSGQATLPPPLTRVSTRSAHDSVPRHIGQIEPWIGGSLAAYTAWMYGIAHRDLPALWFYVAGAVLLALWSWRRPASRQSTLMTRGVLFALMGFAMIWRAGPESAMADVDFFFWISVPALFYAFLLRSELAWWLLGINFVVSAAGLLFTAVDLPLAPIMARAGFLAVFSVAAIRMGAQLRRTDELLEERRVDASSGMLNEYGFVDYGAELWAQCRQASAPATLVFLDLPDLHRVRSLYGAAVARQAIDKVLHAMQLLSTGRNLVGRLSGSRFALLVPGAAREETMYFLGDKLGHPPQIELDDDDLDVLLLVNIHAAESLSQNVSFSRFFEAEREMLDFYFSEHRGPAGVGPNAQPVAKPSAAAGLPPSAPALTPSTPRMRPEPASGWGRDGSPSTLPIG